MALTPPSTAQSEFYHIIVTVWPTRNHRRLGGDALRAATGVLTRTGGVISITDDAGVAQVYPPSLSPGTSVSAMFSTVATGATIELLWSRDSQDPIDFDLQYGEAEISLIDETSGGTAVVAWAKRRRMIAGQVSGYTWGDDLQTLSVTIAGQQLKDDGDFYEPGAELSSDMFGDFDNTGSRDRAPKSEGLLPPLVWAPVDSQIRVPCLVVQDEDDAVNGGPDLVPRRHLISRYRPTNTSAVEQFQFPDPDRDGHMLGGSTDAVYQRQPQEGSDLLGGAYWYVLGDFTETYGSGTTVVFTNGSPDVTATKTGRFLREGWQTRQTGDNDDEWRVAISVDGSTVQLGDSAGAEQNYNGAGGLGGTGDSIPLPRSKADSLFWIPKLGGMPNRDGTAQTHVIDVLAKWLEYASFNVPVDVGSLRALRSRLSGLDLSYVRRTRGSPWAQCLQVLQYIPIRPYTSEGALRFKWIGPVSRTEIKTTIDLDNLGPAYRMEPMAWADDPVYPVVQIQYWWDIFEQKFKQTFAYDGSKTIWSDSSRIPVGRARLAYSQWRDASGVKTGDRCPTLDLKLDTLELLTSSRLAALWLLYRWGMRRPRFSLPVAASLRWLDVGDVIQVTQTGVTYPSQMWRIEGVTWNGLGQGKLVLEGVVN